MNGIDLMKALGDIDEKYIAGAATSKPQCTPKIRTKQTIAVIATIVTLVLVVAVCVLHILI